MAFGVHTNCSFLPSTGPKWIFFFDILTIRNNEISYAKHVLDLLCVFTTCYVVRLPKAALFLPSPTAAVPCARTVRTATSCPWSLRRALRLLATERRAARLAPSGPGHQTTFAHPTACPTGSPLGLQQPRAPGLPISKAHLNHLRRLVHGVPSTCAERYARASIRYASDGRGRSPDSRPNCGGAAAAGSSGCTRGSACPPSYLTGGRCRPASAACRSKLWQCCSSRKFGLH